MARALRVILPIGIVVVGVIAAVTLVKNRPRAQQRPPEVTAPSVVVVDVARGVFAPTIQSTGVVRPAREVSLAAEIAGRVSWVAKELVPGGRVKKGETLVRLDDKDLSLLVLEAKARVSQAELALTLEETQGERAKRELALMGETKLKGASLALALREPQRENAKAQLEAARHALERAELNLARATIRAPMDAVVVTERVDVGQLASPQAVLATLVGVDAAWVFASIPIEKLRSMRVGEGEQGSVAEIMQVLGEGRDVARAARAVRLLGELEPETRTAQVVLEVARPFDVEGGGLPLLPGAFVDVRIAGTPIEGVFVVPRIALVDGDAVWTVASDGKLKRKPVDIVWRDKEHVVVRDGLDERERVVTTPMPMAVDGTPVKTIVASAEQGPVGGDAP